jgi:hypothetical protein
MLRLKPSEQEQLRKAILNAYPGFPGLQQLLMTLAGADIDLTNFFGPMQAGAEYSLFQAIQHLNAQGRSADLIGAVRRGNQADTTLADLERNWLRTVGTPEMTRLEGMVVEQLNYQPGPAWLHKLETAFRWVCRVESAETEKSLGTGFLIDDDLVLTNYHVLFSRSKPNTPRAVWFRFDAADGGSGRIVTPDDTTPQPIEKSPPGGAEWGASGDPSTGELDFALVRLSERLGAEQTAAGTQRGHANLDVSPIALDAPRPLVILEHPLGAPLQICIGSITGANGRMTRVRHNATTQEGSSGSPCLSMELNVVALHNGGVGTQYNTAIPISSIKAALAKHQIAIR